MSRRLDKRAEDHSERFGDQVERRQADVLFTRLDGDQHAPADPGSFSQGRLAQPRGMAQLADVLTDMLQHRSTVRGIFVHYIAHRLGLRSILPTLRRIVRRPL